MDNILLISEDTLKTYSNLNNSVFGKWILPAIRESQEMGLMPIIGECLYEKVCLLVENGLIGDDMYVAYKDLLDDKIQPYLLYQTLSNIVPLINSKLANIGTVATNDEHIVNLSQGESDLVQNYYRERADFYAKRLQEWVKSNSQAFPELECDCGKMEPNLHSSANSVGLFLGGRRGKVVSNGDCGCSSKGGSSPVTGDCAGVYLSGYTSGYTKGYDSGYTSGYTDGAETCDCDEAYNEGKADGMAEQKAKLASTAITSNGTYQREDGFNRVEINVPTTGYTQQDLDNAYDSGYTSGMTSGITSGETRQKAKLATTAFTANGTFQRADGWSAITVNVPQEGDYAQGYSDGYSEGYNKGYQDGQGGGDTGDTGTTRAYVEILGTLNDGDALWNSSADASNVTVYLGAEKTLWTGGRIYTGKTYYHLYYYFSDNIIPNNFFDGITIMNQAFVRDATVKSNAFKNTSLISLLSFGRCVFESYSVRDNANMIMFEFGGNYYTGATNSVYNNTSLATIEVEWPVSKDRLPNVSDFFSGVANNGTLYYYKSDVITVNWWPYLQSLGWTATQR